MGDQTIQIARDNICPFCGKKEATLLCDMPSDTIVRHTRGKGFDTFEKEMSELCKNIRTAICRWKTINQNGCNDPFWTDGCNMNLVRNHVIYYKGKLVELCQANGCPLPDEYYLATPPEVDRYYMAHLKQTERVKRIKQMGRTPVLRRYSYDECQMSLFG